jgi:hypothetical protein
LGLPWLLYTAIYGELHLPSFSLTLGAIIIGMCTHDQLFSRLSFIVCGAINLISIGIAFICSALGLLINEWKLRPLLALVPMMLYGVFVAMGMMAAQAN